MDFSSLPYGSIIVAALATFIIGFLWHGPVFGQTWIRLMKISPSEMEKGQKEMAKKMPLYLVAAFIQQLVVASVIALMLHGASISAMLAIQLAFILWLGFIATTLLNGVLWEKRSIPLYLFNIVYHLVSLVVITLIVGLWK